jgi:hypothetical protein
MATMTYYVALAFKRSEDGGDIVACDPKEARSSEQAIRMAGSPQNSARRSPCEIFWTGSPTIALGGSRPEASRVPAAFICRTVNNRVLLMRLVKKK